MNERTSHFDYLSASIKSSKIPRLFHKFIDSYKFGHQIESIERNDKFWKKFGSNDLKGKQSRIPVFKSKSINKNQKYKTSHCFDDQYFENPFKELIKSTKSEADESLSVKLRSTVGRSGAPNGWTQSEPIDCLKYILEIVRSNSSADNKFKAIKRYRDKRLAIIHQMESFNDNTIGDRITEWVDRSSYITNTNTFRTSDDVFNNNQSMAQSMINQRDLISSRRRRSYNNMRALDLIALNNKYQSFNSEVSMSSISSIDSLLESRREDPEELLLALGFGYQAENQITNRIPQRFLESPSSAKGLNPDYIRKTFGVPDIPSLTSSSSFPSTDFRERSYSCGRISERFQKRLSKESIMKAELPEIITSSCSSLLQSPQSESILNAANRKFLESQGKEHQNQLSSKRLIIGTKSYKLDVDGDPLAFPKTPSPVGTAATTPVPPDTDMELSSNTNGEQINFCDNNNYINFSQIPKRNPFQRQNCVTDQECNENFVRHQINDLSSELSSSTTTLVGTVVSGSNETTAQFNEDLSQSFNKQNTFTQMDKQFPQKDDNRVVEAALVVAIESLKLSLDFYRHQSMKMSKISSQKYTESSNLMEEEAINLSKTQELRECIHKEIVEMEIVLNRHLQSLHSNDALDMSLISQAQVFTEAVKKVRQMLKEQHNLYSQMGLIPFENY